MKKSLMLLVAIIATVLSANAQCSSYGSSSYSTSSYGVNTNSTYVNVYTKSNGTYVQGHYRSSQNSTNHDNYSTSGNYNPYTGSAGSRAKDYSTEYTTMVAVTQSTLVPVAVNTTSTVTATKLTFPSVTNCPI